MRQILTRAQRRIAEYLRNLLTMFSAPPLLTQEQLVKIPSPRLRELAESLRRCQIPLPPLGIGVRRLASDVLPDDLIPFKRGWIRIVERAGDLIVELCLAKSMTGALAAITIRATLLGWRVTNVATTERSTPRDPLSVTRDRPALAALRAALGFALAATMAMFLRVDNGLLLSLHCTWITAIGYVVLNEPAPTRFARLSKLVVLVVLVILFVATGYVMVAELGVTVPAACVWFILGVIVGGVISPLAPHLTTLRAARWQHDLRMRLRNDRWALRRQRRVVLGAFVALAMPLIVFASISRASGPYLYTRWQMTNVGVDFEVERWVDERGEGFQRVREINPGKDTEKALEGYAWTSAGGVRPHRLPRNTDALAAALELKAGTAPKYEAALRALDLAAMSPTTPERRSTVLTLLGRGPGVTWSGSPMQMLIPVTVSEPTGDPSVHTLAVSAPEGVVQSYALSTKHGAVVASWRLLERRANTTAP